MCYNIHNNIVKGDIKMENVENQKIEQTEKNEATKFCKHCGEKIPADAVICMKCGRQVEEIKSEATAQPNIVITNTNTNVNNNGMMGREKNKWVALLLCFFLGVVGGHKFYEGKAGMGILYIFTCGLFGIGVLIDFISILLKRNPYYV